MDFYRFQISSFNDRSKLDLIVYSLYKETPKGYWISKYINEPGLLSDKPFWVSKTSRKRKAYPTEEEALDNFIHRTQRRKKILTTYLDKCNDGLKIAKQIKEEIEKSKIDGN